MGLWLSQTGDAAEGGAAFVERGQAILSSGVLDCSAGPGVYLVDTEGAGATDDLTQVIGLTVGQEVVLKAYNAAREVIIKAGANMDIQFDFPLTTLKSSMKLQSKGVEMFEISRAAVR